MPRAIRYTVLLAFALLTATAPRTSRATTVSAGPMVGPLTDATAKIWLMTTDTATVWLDYSTSSSFTTYSSTAAVTTALADTFTTTFTLSSLSSSTHYYVRAVLRSVVQTGKTCDFTTFPTSSATDSFSFVIMADLQDDNRSSGSAPAYANAAARHPKFLLQIGDMDHRDPVVLTDKREMHLDARTGSLQGNDFYNNFAKVIPTFHIWDNHDFGSGDKFFATSGSSACTAANWHLSQRCDSWKAFKEFWPTPTLPNAPPTTCNGDTADHGGFWYKFNYGKADFIVLDCRSEKTLCSTPPTMLGPTQLSWLETELSNSKNNGASWIFIVSTVTFDSTAKYTTPYTTLTNNAGRGSWGAYIVERNTIAKYIADNGICNVVWISGDLHSGGAADDGSHTGYQTCGFATRGAPEFSCPHTNLANAPDACTSDPDQAETGLPRTGGTAPASCTTGDDQTGIWTWGLDVNTVYASGYASNTNKPGSDCFPNAGPGYLWISVNSGHTQVRVRSFGESAGTSPMQYKSVGHARDLDFTVPTSGTTWTLNSCY